MAQALGSQSAQATGEAASEKESCPPAVDLRRVAGSAALLMVLVFGILTSAVWVALRDVVASPNAVAVKPQEGARPQSRLPAAGIAVAAASEVRQPQSRPPIAIATAPQVGQPTSATVQTAPVTSETRPDADVSRALSGAAILQIGSFDSMTAAMAGWDTFRGRYDVAGLAPDIQKADLGSKGVWYRLRVGPFADKAAAADTCTRLKAAGGTCLILAQ